MIKAKIILLFISAVFFVTACNQDEEIAGTKVAEDDCLTAKASNNGSIIPGEYIVSLSNESTPEGRSSTAARIFKEHNIDAASVKGKIEGTNTYFLMHLSDADASTLKGDTAVKHVEPDRIISMCGCFEVVEPRSITWNVDQVGYGDGTGKVAWIIDSGVDSDHPDLNVDKQRSRSFVDGNSSYEDDNGHGTHVAGIIGAKNNNIGTLGVASGASIVALKVLAANGEGKLSRFLDALSYIERNAKAGDAVNISAEFPDSSQILEEEIQRIASRGIFFALAAGNDAKDANGYSPGRTAGKNIYTVSAVDSLNHFADFSNYGNDVVDFAAPGVKILSAYTEGRYAYLSGTSMAAPHVAGILLINKGTINSNGNALSDPDGMPDPLAHK
jgi:subtilisin